MNREARTGIRRTLRTGGERPSMRRRDLMLLLGGAAIVPRAVRAAEGDADHRVALWFLAPRKPRRSGPRPSSPGTEQNRLRRGPEHDIRVPLGRFPL